MSYAYRSWRRQWGTASARQCGGALVWQLNDCWPAISWAVIDHFLVKKPAFYAIKRALSPVSVTVLRTQADWTEGHTTLSKFCEYDLWIVSSQATGIREAVVEMRFISIRTGNDYLPSQRHNVSVQPNSTTVVCEGIKIVNPSSSDAFVILAKLLIDGKLISRDIDWPQPYKYLDLGKDSGLKVRLGGSRQKIEISALKPTKGLTFNERPGLYFSDNGFDVVPGEEYVVDVEGVKEDELLQWTFLGANGSQSTGGQLRAQL
jgi:beta-mannosidase